MLRKTATMTAVQHGSRSRAVPWSELRMVIPTQRHAARMVIAIQAAKHSHQGRRSAAGGAERRARGVRLPWAIVTIVTLSPG